MKRVKLVGSLFVLAAGILMCGSAWGGILFQDDFSSGLGNWNTGTNTVKNSAPTVGICDGEVCYGQGYDYIETKQSFSGDFEVSLYVEKTAGSAKCMDFIIELTNAPSFSGILRMRYGATDKYSINLGQAPTLTTSDYGNCVDDEELEYLEEMGPTGGSPYVGTVTLAHKSGSVKFSFTHSSLGTIETPWVSLGGDLGSTTVRIWATGSLSGGSPTRFVDNVVVESPTATGGLLIDSSGAIKVGEGGGTPLLVMGDIACTGTISEGSSRALKSNISSVKPQDALNALMGLEPVSFRYRADPHGEKHLGFVAEDVPSLVSTRDRKTIRPMDIIAILASVVQQQQREIQLLKGRIEAR